MTPNIHETKDQASHFQIVASELARQAMTTGDTVEQTIGLVEYGTREAEATLMCSYDGVVVLGATVDIVEGGTVAMIIQPENTPTGIEARNLIKTSADKHYAEREMIGGIAGEMNYLFGADLVQALANTLNTPITHKVNLGSSFWWFQQGFEENGYARDDGAFFDWAKVYKPEMAVA